MADVRAKLNIAAPGDTIVLKNGVYTTTAPLSVRARGEAGRPITLAAESVGGVELAGAGGFAFLEPAAHIVVSGFVFTHAAGKNTIGPGTTHIRYTRNFFKCAGDGHYLSVVGDDAEVDFNEFADKTGGGNMIAVGGAGTQVARRLRIHRNYFHDYDPIGGTSTDMIRFGLTALALSRGDGLVEHNLFVRCRGENDMVSNRSSGNVYRYNTFAQSPTSQFTMRHGNECLVYGNILINTEGIRIFGDRHQVFSNYCEGNYIGINIGNGSQEPEQGTTGAGHDRPDDCLIAFNTLVDNRTHYQLSRRLPEALGATHITFANNLILGGELAVKIEGPYADPIWTGNLLWNSDAGALPPNGFVQADPLLQPAENGLKRPAAGSPAVASAEGVFPTVAFDLDGQPRPAEKKSVGADEPGDAPLVGRLLTPKEVGPLAGLQTDDVRAPQPQTDAAAPPPSGADVTAQPAEAPPAAKPAVVSTPTP